MNDTENNDKKIENIINSLNDYVEREQKKIDDVRDEALNKVLEGVTAEIEKDTSFDNPFLNYIIREKAKEAKKNVFKMIFVIFIVYVIVGIIGYILIINRK